MGVGTHKHSENGTAGHLVQVHVANGALLGKAEHT